MTLKANAIIQDIEQGELQAIMDTPIPYLFDELRSKYPDSIVVLTSRNEMDWAKSRLVEHPGGPSYICAESAMPSGVRRQLAMKVPVLPHPFALKACVKRAIARNQTTPAVVKLTELKKAWEKKLGVQAGVEETLRILSTSLKVFDNYVRQRTPPNKLIEIDLWNDNACLLHNAFENALGVMLPSTWKGKRFGTPVGAEAGFTQPCDREEAPATGYSHLLKSRVSEMDLKKMKGIFISLKNAKVLSKKMKRRSFEVKNLDSISDEWSAKRSKRRNIIKKNN